MNKREAIAYVESKIPEFLSLQNTFQTEYYCSERDIAEEFLIRFIQYIKPEELTVVELMNRLAANPEQSEQFLLKAGFIVKNEDGSIELAKEYR